MKTTTIAALLLAGLLPAAAGAQQVWRCGNSYTQQPCPGGTTVQADDARTAAQAAQTASAARNQAKVADAMEQERLAQEAQAAPANVLPQPKAPGQAEPKSVASRAKAKGKKKAKKPGNFTAVVPKQADAPRPKEKAEKKGSRQSG